MQTKTPTLLPEPITVDPIAERTQLTVNQIQNLNTQVKAAKQKLIRRKFSRTDKLKILEAFDACDTVLARNAFLRKEGLYYGGITKWRKELSEKNSEQANSRTYKLVLENNQIMRENAALKKKLAQAEAVIDLQKKVSELLSTHVLSQKTSEE